MKVKNRGSFLILALWSLSLLAVFSISLGYAVRQKAALLDRIDLLDTLYPIAYSGVEAARGLIKVQDSSTIINTLNDNRSQNKILFKDIPIGDKGYFSVSYQVVRSDTGEPVTIYGLVDEQSKININTADAATINRILQLGASLDKDAAEDIAYCIMDWRDTDSTFEHATYGAEDDYYNHLEVPYGAKNAPFEALDELLLVKGINRAIFDKIKRFVTPFGLGSVNINTAPKEVLLALGLEERLVDKIMDYRRGLDREERTGDDRAFTQSGTIATQLGNVTAIDAAEATALGNLISNGKLETFSTHFMVQSRGVLNKNGTVLDMESVIDNKGKIYYLRASKIQWPSKA